MRNFFAVEPSEDLIKQRFTTGTLWLPKPYGFGPMPMFPKYEDLDAAHFLAVAAFTPVIDMALGRPPTCFSMN